MGKGGGGPSQTTAYQTNLPEYAQPFVTSMLEATQQQLFTGNRDAEGNYNITGFKPYQAYSSDPTAYFAGPTGAQTQAYNEAVNMQAPGQYGEASNLASAAASRALGTQFTPGQFSNQYYAPAPYTAGQFGTNYQAQSYRPGQFGMQSVSAPSLQNYQMGPAERVGAQGVGTGAFTDQGNVSSYMSPYQQAVTDVAKSSAVREAQLAQNQADLAAARQGTYGGSRQLIAKLERERNLLTNLAGIQAKGGQDAYNAAMQAYQSDAARQLQAQQANQQSGLQAALANQQAGLSVGGQNLQALLGVQSLGAGQNLQAQLANQQAYQNLQQQQEASRQFGATFGESSAARLAQLQQAAEQQREASRQFAANQGMTAAQLQAQYGLSAQQAAEASRQFATNAELQGIAQANQAASTLGSIGSAQQQADMARLQLMNQLGQQQQQYQQGIINQQIQDYATAQQYPMMQLGFMSNMLRGLPMQATTTQSYQAMPNLATQAISGLGAAAGAYRAFGMKQGGKVKGLAMGGKPTGGVQAAMQSQAAQGIKAQLENMPEDQVAKVAQTSPSETVRAVANQVLMEKQMEKQAAAKAEQSIAQDQSKGLAAAPAPAMDALGAASGGIVAFANEGEVEYDPNKVYDNPYQVLSDAEAFARAKARREAMGIGEAVSPEYRDFLAKQKADAAGYNDRMLGLEMMKWASKVNRAGPTLGALVAGTGESAESIGQMLEKSRGREAEIAKGEQDIYGKERADQMAILTGTDKERADALKRISDRKEREIAANAARVSDLDKTTTAILNDLVESGQPNNAATKAAARRMAIEQTGLNFQKLDIASGEKLYKTLKDDKDIKGYRRQQMQYDEGSKEYQALEQKIAEREQKIRSDFTLNASTSGGTPGAKTDTGSGRFPNQAGGQGVTVQTPAGPIKFPNQKAADDYRKAAGL